MTALFTRWIPSMTLAVWSAVLLGTYFTGRLTAFLHPSFRPGVMIAGFVLAAIALLIASKPVPPECCADATCTHPLSRSKGGRWLSFLILVLPVSVAAWLSPEHFSKQAFEQRGVVTDATGLGERQAPKATPAASKPATPIASATTDSTPAAPVLNQDAAPAPSSPVATTTSTEPAAGTTPTNPATSSEAAIPEYLQKTPEGFVIVEVLDMLYAVQDSQLRKDFEGRTVQLIAQMMPQKAAPGGAENRFKAVRMFMTCCAADARPVATLVETSPLPELPEMTWVRIVGKATFPVENGKRVAIIQATSVQQTKPPEESMLF
jgi:uncharacterized repeat protein (TIGR03943 family)